MQTRRIDAHKKALFLRPDELDRSVALVLLAARAFEATATTALPDGLAPTHRLILLLLKGSSARTAADLQSVLGLAKQTVSRHVHQLTETGLITREDAADDRRRKLLALTERGLELAERLDRSQRRRLAAVFKAHGPRTVAEFEAVLLDLVAPPARPFFDEAPTR
ncbi:MAG: MarR family winged helix-turn-helix transcriptional regulator [Pseudomonadota bacterium]